MKWKAVYKRHADDLRLMQSYQYVKREGKRKCYANSLKVSCSSRYDEAHVLSLAVFRQTSPSSAYGSAGTGRRSPTLCFREGMGYMAREVQSWASQAFGEIYKTFHPCVLTDPRCRNVRWRYNSRKIDCTKRSSYGMRKQWFVLLTCRDWSDCLTATEFSLFPPSDSIQ